MTDKKTQAFFVTGTDTEIGKTVVTSALVYGFAQRGFKSIGMKTVASGAFEQDGVWHNEDVLALRAASNVINETTSVLMNPYLFKLPIAPHIAAKEEQREIDLTTIVNCYQQLTTHADVIIVEGAGGFNIPLNAHQDSTEMAKQLNLPVILVVGMRLGCINHALLTAEVIKARGLTLAGWVANSAQPDMPYLADNITTLRERLNYLFNAPLLGTIPYLEKPTAATAANYIDFKRLDYGKHHSRTTDSISSNA